MTIGDRAREALRLAEADPRRSAAYAAEVTRAARKAHDTAAVAVAERAWGLAALHIEGLDSAVRHLRDAIAWGRRAGSPELAAEARMTLAFALNQRGRSRQALREIDLAILDLGGVEGARAGAQRGAILHQLGRLDEALASYRAALRGLRRARDHLWVWRVLMNRGVLHAQRYEFGAAEHDLGDAERLCADLDLDLSLGYTQANLGFVHALRGEVPAALGDFARAEQRLRAHHAPLGPLLADRSELLLSVRLVPEAREAAEAAVGHYEEQRGLLGRPEARLMLAQVALLDGDQPTALWQARAAAREFTRQQRTGWAAVARIAALRSVDAGSARSRVAVRQVERAVEALGGAWQATAVEGNLLAAKLALERGRSSQAQLFLVRVSRLRSRGPATLRARAWYAEAQARLTAGNRRGAVSAIRAGLSVLDEHHATFGAVDLRAHAAGHRADLAELGLRLALEDGRGDRVLAWAEVGRASHLLFRPARPPSDPRLARSLAELRGTAREIEDRQRDNRDTSRLVQRQVALERQVRDCYRAKEQHAVGVVQVVPSSQLGASLDDVALIEFVQLDGTLHAVSVVDGRLRLRTLGSVGRISEMADRLPFALHRLARRSTREASRSAARVLLRHAVDCLDAEVLRPIIEAAGRPLIIVPTGPLQSLPWSILPSCVGRPITVVPSAALWHAVHSRRPPTAGHVTVVAGPDLPAAPTEAEAVAAIHGTAALVGDGASVDKVTTALDGAWLAHLAAHGRVRSDNPLFSSLRLTDGPLMVYDLERLRQAPRTVVLAACDSGRSVVRTGDELLGLSAAFLALGSTQLVASVLPVLDSETARLMVRLHQRLAEGRSPAEALADAQRQAIDDAEAAVAAGFVCLGDGFADTRRPVPSTAAAPG